MANGFDLRHHANCTCANPVRFGQVKRIKAYLNAGPMSDQLNERRLVLR